jgi:hypothetical protein
MLVMFVGVPSVSAGTTYYKNFSKFAADAGGDITFEGRVAYLKTYDAYGWPMYTIGYVDFDLLDAYRYKALNFGYNVYTQVWTTQSIRVLLQDTK